MFGTLIKKEIAQGRQAYIVYPLVEESEKIRYRGYPGNGCAPKTVGVT